MIEKYPLLSAANKVKNSILSPFNCKLADKAESIGVMCNSLEKWLISLRNSITIMETDLPFFKAIRETH